MFVRYFVEVCMPFDAAEAALLDRPEGWVPGLARDADDRGERLLGQVGFGEGVRIDKRVEIDLGTPVRMGHSTVIPMVWHADGAATLFPSLEADLEVAALGPERTQLSLNGRYRPPMGAFGRAVDRALLHRVSEATVKDFLDHVAEALDAHAPSRG